MKRRRTYKFETTDNRITLYKRRLWCLWFPVETKACFYPQHEAAIIRQWVREYGIDNFLNERE